MGLVDRIPPSAVRRAILVTHGQLTLAGSTKKPGVRFDLSSSCSRRELPTVFIHTPAVSSFQDGLFQILFFFFLASLTTVRQGQGVRGLLYCPSGRVEDIWTGQIVVITTALWALACCRLVMTALVE